MSNYNSSVNQDIKRKFVEHEVVSCQSSLVDMLMEKDIDGFSYDEVENFYIDNSNKIEELEEQKTELEEKMSEIEEQEKDTTKIEKEIEKLQDKIDELEAEQEEPQEIYEWWLVSKWLADKLRKHNEPILDNDYDIWWGRTCTGQAILLDGVISEICSEMGILEGQAHDWSK